MNLNSSWQTVKQNKDDCVELLEQIHKLLTAIIILYVKSETGAELPPSVLHHIGKFTQYFACLMDIQHTDHWIRILHKIHTFIEAHQKGGKIRAFLRHNESRALLKECKVGMRQGLEFFQVCHLTGPPQLTDECRLQIESAMIAPGLADMEKDAQKRHQEVLDMIETLSENTVSERGSMVRNAVVALDSH
jgi:hypothetical protein